MENKTFSLKKQNGDLICSKVITASDIFSRMKGLMFSEELPNCEGLLISPCNSIHTFFMLYSLDVVFLDKDMKVVKIIYNLKPWKITWIYFKASMVLEMKEGTLVKDLQLNDKLEASCIN